MHSASDVAVAWSLISTILSSRITARSNGGSSLGFRSFARPARTIQGYEAMHMIVCPAQGWCIQRESSPPGQESEAL